MRRWLCGWLLVTLLAGAAPEGRQGAAALSERPPLLDPDREAALALSAAPPAVAADAAVYVLTATGYVKTRDGRNGYVCLVARSDHPLDLTPVCHDRNGAETLLPIAQRREELRATGATAEQIAAEIGRGFESGRFRAPQPGGISYMLSPQGYTWDAAAQVKRRVPPHLMVYAPYATNADLGFADACASEMARSGLPFMRNPGAPDGFIIILVPEGAKAR
jgi:hypothetical protein